MQPVHLSYEDEYDEAKNAVQSDSAILEYIAQHSFVPDMGFLLKTERRFLYYS